MRGDARRELTALLNETFTPALVDSIRSALPEFPEALVDECFRRSGVVCNEETPREFSKFLAVMSVLAGGNLQGKTLLDVGTGLGVLVAQARSAGMAPTGSDTFTEYEGTCRAGAICIFEAYGHSRSSAEEAFIHHDITVATAPARYDFVTSIGMMEHIFGEEARRSAIRNMVLSLVPGGTLIVACGPNQYFPIDFFHYGPKFIFYHMLPLRGRERYLRAFSRDGQCSDARWLDGMRVAELEQHIRDAAPAARVIQAFPLWVRASTSRWMKWALVRKAATALARLLSWMRAEPVIILIASLPE